MTEPTDEFYVVELRAPLHAETLADQISQAYQRALARADGTLRPVLWAGSPLAPAGLLYLSVGAVRAAKAVGIHLAPVRKIRADELPLHRTLLFGTPQDRV